MERKPQSIDVIIHSFEWYGLGDIRHNKEKTIAVMILAICFIDQLASFRYRDLGLADQWEQFIADYMPTYLGLNIYNAYRNTLVHNYSTRGLLGLTRDKNFKEPFEKKGKMLIINTDIFVEKLELAFKNLETDLRDPTSLAHYNAVTRSIKHPVLVHRIV